MLPGRYEKMCVLRNRARGNYTPQSLARRGRFGRVTYLRDQGLSFSSEPKMVVFPPRRAVQRSLRVRADFPSIIE